MSDPGFHSPELEHRLHLCAVLRQGKSGQPPRAGTRRGRLWYDPAGVKPSWCRWAFLMLLRVKEETGEELAGFVDAAARKCCCSRTRPPGRPRLVQLRGQEAANIPGLSCPLMLLAQAGYQALVHGADGRPGSPLYGNGLRRHWGRRWRTAGARSACTRIRSGSAIAPRCFCRPLHELIQLRLLLGLRSPVNTLTRMLNPLRAPCSIQSIFTRRMRSCTRRLTSCWGNPALVSQGR